jgi:hypothetical protein
VQRCPASASAIVVNDESLPQVILSWRDHSIMTRRRHVGCNFVKQILCVVLKVALLSHSLPSKFMAKFISDSWKSDGVDDFGEPRAKIGVG